MRELNVDIITQNIKEMCIEANHFLTDDMKKGGVSGFQAVSDRVEWLLFEGGGFSKAVS